MNCDDWRQHHNVILDSINEGVFTVDLDWTITAFNRAAERITGVRREQAVGRRCCDVFRSNICEHACALRETRRTGQPVINARADIVDSGGNRIPIRIATALLRDDAGTVIGGVETFQDLTQEAELRKALASRYTFEDIIGRSAVMRRLFEIIPQVADSRSTVLLEGSSGTGKELIARAIHTLSLRKNGPFIAVNCGALPDSLLESELFGYVRGAFTDAVRDKPGRFARADRGTLFLDEIGDVSPAMQVRLLRVLQERRFEPLGSVNSVSVDIRVIAATNKDLMEQVRRGNFREDLYYRICVVRMKVPELKERREDIPLLVDHFITKFNGLHGKEISHVSGDVLTVLMEHDFRGNVRELENILEHAFVLCRGDTIDVHHLPGELRPGRREIAGQAGPMSLAAMERFMISESLQRTRGNRRKAAAELGIDVSTLFRKIRRLKIELPDQDGRSPGNS